MVSPLAGQHVPYRRCDLVCGWRYTAPRASVSGPDSADVAGKAAMVTYACDQIDQARTELGHLK
jgi:hypothetical protein